MTTARAFALHRPGPGELRSERSSTEELPDDGQQANIESGLLRTFDLEKDDIGISTENWVED